MDNISSATTFILKTYEKMEHQNNLYLTVFLLPYILTIAMNTLVIVVIYKERALHEPMYIFICNLSCNGIYGSTTFWIFPLCTFPLYLILTIRLSFCSNIIHKTHCLNYDLVKLSCTSTFVNNISNHKGKEN
ncbi:olfactory receptor 6B1-like [Alosa pseudoharengus]|uniref:olfactory receptor 6B1-like n=1 Tax=Alosa pseudoharengus TaxID=34774 RepID=UPI003F88A0F0